MFDYKTLFPNNSKDVLVDIEDIKGNTNFSHMGETSGIEIKCKAKFKVKVENVLMDPDWEVDEFTNKFKEHFNNGYYVFEEFRFEYINYVFFADYNKETDRFELKNVKKIDMPQKNYINSIQKRYNKSDIEAFEKWLIGHIIEGRIKKRFF